MKNWSLIKIKDKIKNIFCFILSRGIVIIPLVSFFVSYNFAKLYFENSIQGYELFLIIPLLVMQMAFVFRYMVELYDVVQLQSRIGHKIKLFVIIIVHIIQLFTNIYLIVIAVDHSMLANIISKTPFELLFDTTYFSVMTFVGGDGILTPQSRWIQSLVMLESMILPIYISIILFGLCGVKHTVEEITDDK